MYEFLLYFLFCCTSNLLNVYYPHLFFLLVAVQPGLWPALLIKMKIDPKDFITKHLNDILPRITTYTLENQVLTAFLMLFLGDILEEFSTNWSVRKESCLKDVEEGG